MYRLKNDRRVIQSAENIRDGLLRCLQKKKFDEVSVSEIAIASGVSRGTFYRIFDTPVDVLSYACDKLSEEASKDISKAAHEDRGDLILHILNFWLNHCEVVEAIYKSGRMDILQKNVNYHHEKYLESNNCALNFTKKEKDYIGVTMASALGSLLYVWVKHGKQESAEELYSIYKRFFLVAAADREAY